MAGKFTFLSEKGEKGTKRLEEVNLLVESFYGLSKTPDFHDKFGVDEINLIQDASLKICDTYYKNLKENKSFMESKDGEEDTRVNRYKIASGIEIAICEVQPFATSSHVNNVRIVNSYFAVFAAIGILMAWEDGNDYLMDYTFPNLNPSEQKEIHRLLIEHIDWLCLVKSNAHLYYFSNAQTWWALRMLLRELNEIRI
ncbi:hypothetical protein EMA8858_03052 [Emticicia aquatica]|uniref:Uncharacterized protein n=1 Tax=Emticicia aquatica TaxID=1681835 RepID=A0ABN8EV52_9BACT|nr:hypothetical protein [Emticicia aquatica]CAH0996917.1 hypothetical protein EMA8858_03052 [Emticicia aquatica]